jgi:hypothetical protein
MITCRTRYKSYTDENTHIHVLFCQIVIETPEVPICTSRTYERCVRTDRSIEVRVEKGPSD